VSTNSEPSVNILVDEIPELQSMRRCPEYLSYIGDTSLLRQRKISIVGTRRPSQYTRKITHQLAHRLAVSGFCIVSGCAMGVDAIAHSAAGAKKTIAVMGNGLDIRYPKVNAPLISEIESEGLCLSPFEAGFRPTKWSFVARNEIVAALGEVLIVTEADSGSGSLRSVEFALKMGRPVYVLPHRIDESLGTNGLLSAGKAEAIYDIDTFIEGLRPDKAIKTTDPVHAFCSGGIDYDTAYAKFGEQLFEYELDGKIEIVSGRVFPV
jgi:DNA processing protein